MKPLLLLAAALMVMLFASSKTDAGSQQSTLVVHVINDLNENGVRDEGEPGLEGWYVKSADDDIIYFIGYTGPDGSVVAQVRGGVGTTVETGLEFGWLRTSPGSVRIYIAPGGEVEVTFLVRDLGDDIERFSGLPTVQGLPVRVGTVVDAWVDGVDCGEGEASQFNRGYPQSSSLVTYRLYVLGVSGRPSCADEGDNISFTIEGVVAGSALFEAGENRDLPLAVGGIPMRFRYSYESDGVFGPVTPYVGDTACGGGFPLIFHPFQPPNAQDVFVQPAESVPGCGVPGAIVDLRVGDILLEQVLWQEGPATKGSFRRPGDTDCDSDSDSTDAALTLQFGAALLAQLPCADAADVSRDGRTDSRDAALILQLEAGLIDYFP